MVSFPIVNTAEPLDAPNAAPPCAGPDPVPRPPRFPLPPTACDCHAHICGPHARYAYARERVYTPPDALLPNYLHLLDVLGVARAVLIQPSVYAADNTVLLDALAQSGGRCRAVVVVDPGVTDDALVKMHAAGVRGVRINVVDVKEGKGTIDMPALRELAARIRPLGWHMEFLMHVDEHPDLDSLFEGFPVEIVLGHLGYLHVGKGITDPGFQAMLRLMRAGRCWAKLTGPYRISSATALPYADVVPLAQALMDAAPEQVLWGTDWPHVMVRNTMPNDGELCNLLQDWIPDDRLRHRVLVENPARLYGF